MSEEEKEQDLTEITKRAFMDELAKYNKEQQDKGSISENAMAKEGEKGDKKDEPSPKKPYTIEELRKLSETEKEKALDKIEEERIDADLMEKYKALQGMATKRQQYLAEKEKEYDKKLQEFGRLTKELTEIEQSLRDKVEELSTIDPDLAEILDKIKNKKGELEKYNQEIASKNWQEAELKVREEFPDFGIYSEAEMVETLKKNPRLLELAQIDNGRFGDVVLAATHILTMLKEDNLKKLIASELINNPKKYEDIIDKIIVKKIEEIEKKNEKKKNFTKLTESKETKEASTISQKGKERVEYKHSFRDEFMNLMNNPEYLEEVREKMKKGG